MRPEGAPRKLAGAAQKSLFATPLSRQRYDMVARVLREAGARSVLDCGESVRWCGVLFGT